MGDPTPRVLTPEQFILKHRSILVQTHIPLNNEEYYNDIHACLENLDQAYSKRVAGVISEKTVLVVCFEAPQASFSVSPQVLLNYVSKAIKRFHDHDKSVAWFDQSVKPQFNVGMIDPTLDKTDALRETVRLIKQVSGITGIPLDVMDKEND